MVLNDNDHNTCLVNLFYSFLYPLFIEFCLSVAFMLRNRTFRLFVFHILLAVPFVILSAAYVPGLCVNTDKTHGFQNLSKCFKMAVAVANPS